MGNKAINELKKFRLLKESTWILTQFDEDQDNAVALSGEIMDMIMLADRTPAEVLYGLAFAAHKFIGHTEHVEENIPIVPPVLAHGAYEAMIALFLEWDNRYPCGGDGNAES